MSTPNSPEPRQPVPANLAQFAFKPGQSGNPGGRTVAYAECQRLCREASPRAAERLIELIESPDERVALMAADKVLERAWGKPKQEDPKDRPPMDRERILELLRYASTLGVPPSTEARVVDVTPGESEESHEPSLP